MFRRTVSQVAKRVAAPRQMHVAPAAIAAPKRQAHTQVVRNHQRRQTRPFLYSAFYKPTTQLGKLGTETAFAVGAECAEHGARSGMKTYPFHLGDLNFPTPKIITDAAFKAIQEGKTGYCPPAGIPQIREALAAHLAEDRGVKYTAENVCMQSGGKPVIGKFIMATMNPGDEVLYPNPGYPIYESQIKYHDGVAVPYTYTDDGRGNISLNVAAMEKLITPKTKILIWNDLHNPTGFEASAAEREAVAELVRKYDLLVLADEAYYDVRYSGKSHSLVSLEGMAERSCILYTFSKKYAMTGWRLGAAIGPKNIIDFITRLNVNDESCSNHFVQYGALAGLTDPHHTETKAMIEELRARRDLACDMLNDIKGVYCSSPTAAFYLYPNVTELVARKGFHNAEELRKAALKATGVSFCEKHHFGSHMAQEQHLYLRFAFSGISQENIKEGLGKLQEWLK